MLLLVTDVFLLLTQVLLWILVGLAARFVLLKALPKAFLGSLVLVLLVVVAALTFFKGAPEQGLLGDIWQVIALLFNPLGLIVIFLCIVWRDAENKGINATSKWLLRIAVPALLLMSLPAFSNFIAQRSEFEAIQIAQPDVPALPAGARRVIVLMGQDTTQLKLQPRTGTAPAPQAPRRGANTLFQPPEPISEGRFSLLATQPMQLTDQGDRILYAAQLFESERLNAPLLVVSAGPRTGRVKKSGDNAADISEASDIRRLLQSQFGIPGTSILQDDNSRTVIESAQNVRQLLENAQINYGNQLMVVTSAIESSRTALTFSREFAPSGQGVTIISRPTDFHTVPPKGSLESRVQGRDLIERGFLVSDLLPSVDAFSLSSKVVNESLTSLYYFLRGWIRPLRAS